MTALVVVVFGAALFWTLRWFADHPFQFFRDADLYWEATAAWLRGESPWQVQLVGTWHFAGWPPTLLLNLPLQPFGPWVARPFWAITGLAGMIFTIRRFGLPWYFLLWPPFFLGWLAGSPDPALLGFTALGAGWIAGLTKPYTIPALLGRGQWRAVLVAGAIAAASLLLLPWGQFFAERDAIAGTIGRSMSLSAWGQPVLVVAAGVALLSLDWRRRLMLVVPALMPATQLHYHLFSGQAVGRSLLLFVGLGVPVPYVAPLAIIAYAVLRRADQGKVEDRLRREGVVEHPVTLGGGQRHEGVAPELAEVTQRL